MTSRANRRYLDWLISDGYRLPPDALGLYRIAYVSFVLLFMGTPSYVWLADIPDFLFDPPVISPTSLLTGLPPAPVLYALTYGMAVLYVALLFGYRTKAVSLLLAGSLLLGNSLVFTFGKINHDDLFIMIIPAVLAFSGWGDRYSIDSKRAKSRRVRPGWPVALLALLLGFAMFTAGIPKLLGGWLDPSTAAVNGHLVQRFYAVGIDDYLVPTLISLHNRPFWELLDYAAVLFEIGFLIAVLWPRIFRLFVATAVLFHLGNLLGLNISFTANLILYLLFIDWKPIIRFADRRRVSSFLKVFQSSLVMIGSILALVVFVAVRSVVGGDVVENALRAAVNVEAPVGFVSLLDIPQWIAGVEVDINLVILIGAVVVIALQAANIMFRRQSHRYGGP